MEREYSYPLTQKQYNYLLPVYGIAAQGRTRLLQRTDRKHDKYYFIGTYQDYKEALNRCLYLNA
jgi:hypothetical protein